jgi:hypothetical protein
MSVVVDINRKRRRRTPRDLAPLDKTSGAARFFQRMVTEIEIDLSAGHRHKLTRIQGELIRASAGAATTLLYLNAQVALGETSEIDLAGYSQMASTMLRIGSRLGLHSRPPDATTLDDYLTLQAMHEAEAKAANELEEAG